MLWEDSVEAFESKKGALSAVNPGKQAFGLRVIAEAITNNSMILIPSILR
jgi:hypothetical protein